MEFDPLSNRVIGCAIEVHRHLGPGLLESAYSICLAHELQLQGITFQKEWPLPVEYKGIYLDCGYRLDFLIANELIVELKSIEKLLPIHEAQLLSYLKLSGKRTGLLVNFNERILKNGIKRMVL
jgi:GxxExxY protein